MNRNNVGWSDYIIDKMKQESKDFIVDDGKEFPKLEGLRWAARNFLGPIRAYSSPPVRINGGVACHYTVECRLRDDIIENENLPYKTESHPGSADCTEENDGGNIYRTAYADSRAEARALVRLLALNRCSAEEFTKNNKRKDVEFSEPNKHDILQHEIISQRLGINLDKFYKYNKCSKDNLSREKAIKLADTLNDYQNNPSSIPKDIK